MKTTPTILTELNNIAEVAELMRSHRHVAAHLALPDGVRGNYNLPDGNIAGAAIFAALLRAELVMDGIEVLSFNVVGEFNHSHYLFFLPPERLNVGALMLDKIIERNAPWFCRLIEIVDIGMESSTVIASTGLWESYTERVAMMLEDGRRAARNMALAEVDLAVESAQRASQVDRQIAELAAAMERLQREIDERDGGDEWKKGK